MNKIITLLGLMAVLNGTAQNRIVADCTVTYSITSNDSSAEKKMLESLNASTKTVYIRGNDSRTDLISPSFLQSLIYDKTTGGAVILREFGNNKFMTRLDKAKWEAENQKYAGMNIVFEEHESKIILGYPCTKATISLKDGSKFSLFYTRAIVPSVKEFEYQFKDIPGFVLEYEARDNGGKTIRFAAKNINLGPVLASRFDIPTSGYRLID
ncbi:MAG: hypothetical protein RLZZ28_2457 [Bacteroidota bacterium]|jgi:GLPGLI family protein